jgi:DNA polymerase-3 subunit delta
MAKKPAPGQVKAPPVVVIFGDEEYQKSRALVATRNELLPPPVDPGLALSEYDGSRDEETGGPAYAAIADDLATLPFLTDRRVVVIRDADRFISAHRERLERYFAAPSPTGTLVLVCRSFPKTTRLYKAAAAIGRLVECKRLSGRSVIDFVTEQFAASGKRIDYPTAARLAELIGNEQAALAGEVEKLCLYASNRSTITAADVDDLVGQSREEKIFAAMDAAAAGAADVALTLWNQVLETDRAAAFKAVGGIAFVLRKWQTAHNLRAAGLSAAAIAPKVMMWGRESELDALLCRLDPTRIQQFIAALAELDAQAKSGARSIETGVEALLIEIADAA